MQVELRPERATSIIPGFFYDLLVYYASSALFFLGFYFISFDVETLVQTLLYAPFPNLIVSALLLLAVFHAYGQFASAISAYVIKKPVSMIITKLNVKQLKDYKFDYISLLEKFKVLKDLDKAKPGNYWTLIYYIKTVNLDIGDDLIKRYGRVKLARTNAFNFLLLLIYILIRPLVAFLSADAILLPSVGNPLLHALLIMAFMLGFSIEFYQRQCWFGDIVTKVYAAICETQSLGLVHERKESEDGSSLESTSQREGR